MSAAVWLPGVEWTATAVKLLQGRCTQLRAVPLPPLLLLLLLLVVIVMMMMMILDSRSCSSHGKLTFNRLSIVVYASE